MSLRILLNNPRDELEGIIQQYSVSLRRTIVNDRYHFPKISKNKTKETNKKQN